MDAWLEAYRTWPPMNQLAFSVVLVIIGLVVLIILILGGLQFVRALGVLVRGWPAAPGKDDPARPTWDDMKELAKHMHAYRKWDEQRRQEAAKVKASGPPTPGGLFEKPLEA